MKTKNIIVMLFVSLVLFLYLDNKTYYYGFGNGFLCYKLPPRFEIIFADSDLGNQGMILKENYMNLHIIRKNDSLFTEYIKKKFTIKKFLGYWFNDKIIIAKVNDKKNNNRFI